MFATIPFVLVQGMTFIDGYFEVISAITTTGLTIMGPELVSAPASLIFWRSLLSWIGGMGIVVMAMMGMLSTYSRSFRLIKAEQQDSKLKLSIRNTMKKIFGVYGALTLLGVIILVAAGMDIFNAVNYSMSAISTTGLDTAPLALVGLNNAWISAGLAFIMLLGATSFSLHYLAIHKRSIRSYWNNSELKVLIMLTILGGILIIPKMITFYGVPAFAMEVGFFSSATCTTCGGFNIVSPNDVSKWDSFVKLVLIGLMFIGGSSGSTAGGIKISRAIIFTKSIYWRTKALLLPDKSFFPKIFEHRTVEDKEVRKISQFIVLYLFFIVLGVLVFTFFGYGIENSLFEVVSAQSNGGISAGLTHPDMPLGGKIMLILNMWIGRLEIIPVMAAVGYLIAPKRKGRLKKIQ